MRSLHFLLEFCNKTAGLFWAACKTMARIDTQNLAKNRQKSLKMGSKSIKNLKKWCQGALRKRSWKLGRQFEAFVQLSFTTFGAIWVILGFFLAQLGAKGLTKSSFLAPSRTKISKNEAQNEASKNI